MSEIKDNELRTRIAYNRGVYQVCRLLLTSPRFNKPQREIIEDQALDAKGRLEDDGVSFSDHSEIPRLTEEKTT